MSYFVPTKRKVTKTVPTQFMPQPLCHIFLPIYRFFYLTCVCPHALCPSNSWRNNVHTLHQEWTVPSVITQVERRPNSQKNKLQRHPSAQDPPHPHSVDITQQKPLCSYGFTAVSSSTGTNGGGLLAWRWQITTVYLEQITGPSQC